MKGVQIFVVLLGLAVAAGAVASSPAPSPESRTCVPDKWQGLSFTTAEGKHKAIFAKSAVDVQSQKAASEFVVFGHHHHHHHHDHHHHHRHDLAPKVSDLLESFEPGKDFGKHGKGVVKVIADFKEEKVYITFHKKTDDKQITFCKVKDFDYPLDLETALCLPEKAKKGGDIVLGGSLDVDMYFIKARRAIVQVSLAQKNNFPVSVTAVKRCGRGAVQTVYFNITKDIDEGFFEVPASCGGKVEADAHFEKYFEHITDTLKHQTMVGNPVSKLFGGAASHQAENEHSETIKDKLASIWHGLFGSQQKDNEFVSVPKIMMYGA